MISNSYSTARMWSLTKRYAVENRRNILITLGVMFGLILLYSIVITKACFHESHSSSAAGDRAVIIWGSYLWFSSLIVTIIGSLTFSSMSTKPKRISNMMLPAAQSEKFISQCLLYVVGGNIATVLILLLSDTISALTFGCAPGWTLFPVISEIADLIKYPGNINGFLAIILGVLWIFLFSQSIYVLGSALWPKKSFLKTFIALFALQILIPIIMPVGLFTGVLPNVFQWLEQLNRAQAWELVWTGIAAGYILLGVIYFLAWQRFKRLEIVKRFLN